MGSIALVSGEIAEDVTAYFAESEQIPTACALGVLVQGAPVRCSPPGAISFSCCPGPGEETITKVEGGLQKVGYVTGHLKEGQPGFCPGSDPGCAGVSFEIEILETCPVEYRCYCSRDRVVKALISMGPGDAQPHRRAGSGGADLPVLRQGVPVQPGGTGGDLPPDAALNGIKRPPEKRKNKK